MVYDDYNKEFKKSEHSPKRKNCSCISSEIRPHLPPQLLEMPHLCINFHAMKVLHI